MNACIAPSEVPSITSNDSRIFGQIAEDLIYMDICRKQVFGPFEIYVDDNNESSYLLFLKKHNPSLNLINFSGSLSVTALGTKRPDLLIHSFIEKIYYEIKPNSNSGRRAGINKLGILSATYKYFRLPYKAGLSYTPTEIIVASFAGQLTIKLSARLEGPGLILYKLCLDSNAYVDVLILSLILAYAIHLINKQAGSKSFKPVDLKPAFAREGQLNQLARSLGIIMTGAAAVVSWRYFWKAVVLKFAVRGTTAAFLASIDGPLPVGDLIACGMALWMIVDITRSYDELWRSAGILAGQQATIY